MKHNGDVTDIRKAHLRSLQEDISHYTQLVREFNLTYYADCLEKAQQRLAVYEAKTKNKEEAL